MTATSRAPSPRIARPIAALLGGGGAIANRIAWLLKETGHDFAARRQFNRARGAYATHTPYVTYAIIAICVAVFVADAILAEGSTLGGGFRWWLARPDRRGEPHQRLRRCRGQVVGDLHRASST